MSGVALSAISRWCRQVLEYPESASLSLDTPETTLARLEIIRGKRVLREIYDEWYESIARALPPTGKPVLEIGSGAGFLSDHVDGLITSDILELPHVDLRIDASAGLPFEHAGLRAIAMVNTLHHLPDVTGFLREAVRCVEPGGRITMVEPWNTRWSRFVYGGFHHEPFDPAAGSWTLGAGGPLSNANGALPWILFVRDRERFHATFPELEITALRPLMPFRYLLSGGVGMRALVPVWSSAMLSALERACRPAMGSLAMFAQITLERR